MSSTEITRLNRRFGLPGRLAFAVGPRGLIMAELAGSVATARVALQGGQLLGWQPQGAQPVIWLSPAATFVPGRSIRGGIPVCWPWFGPHATRAEEPRHGYARTSPWEVIGSESLADGGTGLSLRLLQDAARAPWSRAVLEIRFRIGATLEIELVTRNLGSEPITLGEALHSYFRVGDVTAVAVEGLEDCDFLDMVDGARRGRQRGPVTVGGETDRVYLDARGDCVIDDPAMARRIRISKRGSASTVVWNPWLEKADRLGDLGEDGCLHMLCVESANAAGEMVELAGGGEHALWVRCALEPRERPE